MNFDKVRRLLGTKDGSLPDINFDFGQAAVVADAYALVQSRAGDLSGSPFYWSKTRNEECPIRFGDNPARALLEGEAEVFHVVFGGMRSTTGTAIPDLGVFILGASFLALDYRMGPEWNDAAIVGFFELMRDLAALSDHVAISHTNNIFDNADDILISAFKNWSRV